MSARLSVSVKPGSKAPGIVVSGLEVTVRVREPAVEGRATEAARRALAAVLQISRGSVTLARGATSRHKAFDISGLTTAEILARLERGAVLRHRHDRR